MKLCQLLFTVLLSLNAMAQYQFSSIEKASLMVNKSAAFASHYHLTSAVGNEKYSLATWLNHPHQLKSISTINIATNFDFSNYSLGSVLQLPQHAQILNSDFYLLMGRRFKNFQLKSYAHLQLVNDEWGNKTKHWNNGLMIHFKLQPNAEMGFH